MPLKLVGKKVVYFDTDAIFFIEDEETLANMKKYMPTQDFLGGWKIEEELNRAQFAAPKRYKGETTDGETYIKAGGINFIEYLTEKAKESGLTELSDIKDYIKTYRFNFDEINIISSKWKVQRAYRVKGGTIIEFQEKEIKIPEKYSDIYHTNVVQ